MSDNALPFEVVYDLRARLFRSPSVVSMQANNATMSKLMNTLFRMEQALALGDIPNPGPPTPVIAWHVNTEVPDDALLLVTVAGTSEAFPLLQAHVIHGNGVTDDTAAIQHAIDLASAAHRPPAPTFDDLMRVLFFSRGSFFLDCQECAIWTEVREAFPEQFARYVQEYALTWEQAHPGRAYQWRTSEKISHDERW